MLLICTPTIQTLGGFESQGQPFLALGGFVERTPQAAEFRAGVALRSSVTPFAIKGGYDTLATPTSFPLSIRGGWQDVISPAIQIGGGFQEYTPRAFRALAGMSGKVSVSGRLASGGVMQRVSREMTALAGLTARTPQGVAFFAGVDLGVQPDEQLAKTFVAWVLNLSGGHSRYSNYAFTGFAEVGGVQLACSEEGLFRLDSDTDEGVPIIASALTPIVNMGTDLKKRLPEIYLTARSAGSLVVRLIHDEHTEQEQDSHGSGMEYLKERRVQLGRASSLDFNRVQMEITNPDGLDFEILKVEADPIASSNRRGR